jgi:hypothetical protein
VTVALYLRQCRDHDFAEISLILCVQSDHGGLMCTNYRFTRSNYSVVRLGRQFVGQQQQNQATLQEILRMSQYRLLDGDSRILSNSFALYKQQLQKRSKTYRLCQDSHLPFRTNKA